MGGRTVCRLLVRDAAGDSESTLLHETAPQWVTDVVIEKNIPKFLKIPFFLQPHPQMTKPERTKKVAVLDSKQNSCSNAIYIKFFRIVLWLMNLFSVARSASTCLKRC